jgi:hypothetical protein
LKKPSIQLFMRQRRLARYWLRAISKRHRHPKVKKERSVNRQRFLSSSRGYLAAPVDFSLVRGGGAEVVGFLGKIAKQVLQEHKPVKLDFRTTERFMVPGALILYAELNRIISLSVLVNPIKIIQPSSNRVKQVMKQVGLFELLGSDAQITTNRADVIYWQLAKGATQSGDELAIVDSVAHEVNQRDLAKVEASGLWRGISEAVNNAHEHGYKFPRADGAIGIADTKWWLLTQIRDQRFTAAVCDIGCGYARTLKPEVMEWFQGLFPRLLGLQNEDTLAIQAAMEYGRTSTKQNERGRGSRDALALLQKHGEGELYVLSNRGYVQYACRNGEVNLKRAVPLDFDIQGTIIWWNLDLRIIHDHN